MKGQAVDPLFYLDRASHTCSSSQSKAAQAAVGLQGAEHSAADLSGGEGRLLTYCACLGAGCDKGHICLEPCQPKVCASGKVEKPGPDLHPRAQACTHHSLLK